MDAPDFFPADPAKLLPLLLSCLLWIGCASPGTPRPPSLRLPAPVTDLAAERVGDEVQLHWTTSDRTTDGLLIAGPVTAEVCRSVALTPCTPVGRIAVRPGPSETTEALPAPLRTGPATLLSYRVELRNDKERSAGPSAPAYAVGGPAPAPVIALHATATAQGALLQWEPGDGSDAVELERRRIDTAAKTRPQTKTPGAALPGGSPLPDKTDKDASLRRLLAGRTHAGDGPFHAEAGGSLDTSALWGASYGYTAERVRTTTLAGHSLELRSAPSPAAMLVMRDIFPPRPPRGLEAIASAGDGDVSPNARPGTIDLSWQPNTEPDLAGYRVYRVEHVEGQRENSAPVSLTPGLLQVPGFRDATAVAGRRYLYTVTAVDGAGNESAPSAPASEELRLP